MPFQDAGPAEIKVKGVRWWIKWHSELEIVTNAAYFILTSVLGNQTLGEEYVNILQVDQTKARIPPIWRRAAMASLHVGGFYAIDYIAHQLLKHIRTHPIFLQNHPEGRQFLLRNLPQLNNLIAILHRCHLVIFYFRAHHHHISKQFTGVRYVLLRNWLEDTTSRWVYWLLGSLSLVQLLLSTMQYVNFYWSTKERYRSGQDFRFPSRESTPERSNQSSNKTCSLCLESLSSPTATPCGHIYCWECIINSLERKQQCPLCCAKVEPSRLIYLKNYT